MVESCGGSSIVSDSGQTSRWRDREIGPIWLRGSIVLCKIMPSVRPGPGVIVSVCSEKRKVSA
jgi:hypothetical protein